jgi:peroxiredoxin
MSKKLKKVFCFSVTIIFFILTISGPALAKRISPLAAGDDVPELALKRNFSKADYKYLGIKKSKKDTFHLSEIQGDLILLEILSVYCPSCQSQAPVFSKLYDAIEKDPRTKGRVKMIGVAAGSNEREIETFKKRYSAPFPIVPDEKFGILDVVGSTRAPFNILIRKSKDEMVIAQTHLGVVADHAAYFEDMNTIMTYKIAAIRTEKKGSGPVKVIKPDISQERLVSLLKGGVEEVGEKIKEWKEIKLADDETVYMGTTKKGKLFAKLVSREAICDVCENTHFIFVFDKEGKVMNLVPVSLTKYGNKNWDEKDIKTMKGRVIGKYLYNPFDFDSRVDAVSTATMTSVLIFNSLERANTIYKELKEKGYLH